MAKQNIELVRGDTLAFGFKYTGTNQELDTCYFTIKADYDGNTLVQKDLDDGIEIDTSTENSVSYKVRVAPEDTHDLDVGTYYYDLQIGMNDDIFTILRGSLKLVADITREV